MRGNCCSRGRFTLVEMVVVAVIIAVLMSLLLPSLARARRKGQAVTCMSNLRQIGIAAQGYVSDNDDYALPGKFEVTTRGNYNHWINYLYEVEMAQADIYRCPSLKRSELFNPAGGSNAITEASYIMNIIESGISPWAGSLISSHPDKSRGWGKNSELTHMSQVAGTSTSFFIMDAVADIHDSHSGVNKFLRSDHGVLASPPTGQVRWVGIHHNGGYHVLFPDGHVESRNTSPDDGWVVTIDP